MQLCVTFCIIGIPVELGEFWEVSLVRIWTDSFTPPDQFPVPGAYNLNDREMGAVRAVRHGTHWIGHHRLLQMAWGNQRVHSVWIGGLEQIRFSTLPFLTFSLFWMDLGRKILHISWSVRIAMSNNTLSAYLPVCKLQSGSGPTLVSESRCSVTSH